jgi:hypothetical protein
MGKDNNLSDYLLDIANAIREKKGTTDPIKAQDFSKEIASIETGGGSGEDTPTPDMPVIGDGKTYLYIKIAEKGRMTVSLFFSQTVADGVTIYWGDGTLSTVSGTNKVAAYHTYVNVGEYTISLNPSSGCTLGLGHDSNSYCIMGSTGNAGRVYCNMLKAVEIGNNVTSIGSFAFSYCYSLARVVIPQGVTSISNNAFSYCYSLSSIVIPDSVTSIGTGAFNFCYSLANIFIPDSITSLGKSAFYYCHSLTIIVIPQNVTSIDNDTFFSCYGMAYYDFRASTAVPALSSTSVFEYIPSDCKIVVPDSLYDTWIAATNWSTYASYIVKASEFNG